MLFDSACKFCEYMLKGKLKCRTTSEIPEEFKIKNNTCHSLLEDSNKIFINSNDTALAIEEIKRLEINNKGSCFILNDKIMFINDITDNIDNGVKLLNSKEWKIFTNQFSWIYNCIVFSQASDSSEYLIFNHFPVFHHGNNIKALKLSGSYGLYYPYKREYYEVSAENYFSLNESDLNGEETKIKRALASVGRIVSPATRAKLRVNALKRVEERLATDNKRLIPMMGNHETSCLDILQTYIPFNILRNIDKYKDNVGAFPDGYIHELKLVIEFDEKYHFKDRPICKVYKNKDVVRELLLAAQGLIIFRITEKEWLENQSSCIDRFKILIEELNG